jgi:hypothetical protein
VYGETAQFPTGVSNPKVVVTATCPTGHVAISGGAYVSMSANFFVQTMAGTETVPTSWRSWVSVTGGGVLPAGTVITATAYAVCVSQ